VLMDTGAGQKKSRSVTESSYGAADMLIQQSRSFITQETPLEIGTLTDLDNPNERTNFGQMITGQIASRFVQLGYNVASGDRHDGMPSEMAPSSPVSSSGNHNRALITGRYAVARDEVLVNLRIIEAGSGKVLAAYDYNIPKTRDVRELTKTQADKESFFNF